MRAPTRRPSVHVAWWIPIRHLMRRGAFGDKVSRRWSTARRGHVMWRERAREKDREEEKRCGEAADGARRARGHIARGRAAAPHAAAVPLVVMKCQSSKRFGRAARRHEVLVVSKRKRSRARATAAGARAGAAQRGRERGSGAPWVDWSSPLSSPSSTPTPVGLD